MKTLEERMLAVMRPTVDSDGKPLNADTSDRLTKDAWERFAFAAERTFSTVDGQRVLSLLCKVAHPMASRFDGARDAIDAARRDGECGIVALLWSFSSTTKPN